MEQPSWLTAQLVVSVVLNLLMANVVLLIVAYLIYLERKISAYIQDRIGPNRVGFDFGLPGLKFLRGAIGLGQPLADGLKFLLKEDYTPRRVDKVLFTLAPAMIFIPAMIGFILMPWGGVWNCPDIHLGRWVIAGGLVHVTGANINIGVVYLLAVASLGTYGVTLGGWASNNKFSFLGGLRATAQMISYEIPMGLGLLAVLLVVGSLLPDQLVRHQVEHGWLILNQPLAAFIFFIAILAEANRAPFDNAEAEQELVGGYHTEYSSMRFALFFLAEYAHLITSSAFFIALFLGGYHLPFVPALSPEAAGLGAVAAKVAVYILKVLLMISFTMVVRWTIPRLRYDQVMMVAWQSVIPLGLAVVVADSVMVYFDLRGLLPMLAANGAVVVGMLLVQPFMPRVTVNRRIQLIGSRFSPTPGEAVATRPTDAVALEDRPEHGGTVQPVALGR